MPEFRFDAPGGLTELSTEALDEWSAMMADHLAQFAFTFDRFFDPSVTPIAADAQTASIVWSAAPARLLSELPDLERWQLADQTRDQQDEYCEWRVTRNAAGLLTGVTFTTEVPEYWSHIAEHDRDLLVRLYQELVSPQVKLDDLVDADGHYLRDNQWNGAQSAGLTHLRQGSNTLLAAIRLAAESTVQRTRGVGGPRVDDRQELVRCGQLGEPKRNSDPQIADTVNDKVADGLAVTLANPMGLYLDGLQSAGFEAPDGTNPADFWQIQRGTADHAVRAHFSVPQDRGYSLGDLTIHGRPVAFGTQVAEHVRVRLDAALQASAERLQTQPCLAE